jgi:hypothetical protein
MDIWSQLLSHLLDWPDAKVHDWLDCMSRLHDLDDPNSWIYHDYPSYAVVPEIIRHHFGTKLSDDVRTDVHFRILDALDYGRHDFAGSTDWNHYRRAIDRTIKQFRLLHSDTPVLAVARR